MVESKRPLSEVVAYAKDFQGVPYIWGGNSFLHGLDCSGFIQHLLLYMGIYDFWDRSCRFIAVDLIKKGGVPILDKKAGCILFYGQTPGEETHVAFAISDEELIESGGAGRDCKTRTAAQKLNANVRIKNINHRNDFLYSIPITFTKEVIMTDQDIDKASLIAEGLNELVDVGEKVFADGVVNWKDIEHSDDLMEAAKKIYNGFKDFKELKEEIKDIDPAEAVVLLQKILG